MGSDISVAPNPQQQVKGQHVFDNVRPYSTSWCRRPLEACMTRSRGGHARSAISGRYVTKATAARHPRTTVVESGGNRGSGTHSRSAITGRYVTGATARRHPNTTTTEKG